MLEYHTPHLGMNYRGCIWSDPINSTATIWNHSFSPFDWLEKRRLRLQIMSQKLYKEREREIVLPLKILKLDPSKKGSNIKL